MRSSKWHSLGNSYLVLERAELDRPLDVPTVQELSAETDGIVEIVDAHGGEADVQIWNPDGSRAEFSGNGARIAAAWLAQEAGPDITLCFGTRVARARVDGTTVALDVGAVEVGPPEELDVGGERVTFTPVSVGNPHAVVRRDFDDDRDRAARPARRKP